MGLSADPQERTGRNAERVPAIAQGCQAGVLEPWCPTALGRLSDQSGWVHSKVTIYRPRTIAHQFLEMPSVNTPVVNQLMKTHNEVINIT
ncbi:MAG: hypothetical protein R3F19_11090 [Verrucomicrobiales bacterium]